MDSMIGTERMIKDAIGAYSALKRVSLIAYPKSSYPNNTQVRRDNGDMSGSPCRLQLPLLFREADDYASTLSWQDAISARQSAKAFENDGRQSVRLAGSAALTPAASVDVSDDRRSFSLVVRVSGFGCRQREGPTWTAMSIASRGSPHGT